MLDPQEKDPCFQTGTSHPTGRDVVSQASAPEAPQSFQVQCERIKQEHGQVESEPAGVNAPPKAMHSLGCAPPWAHVSGQEAETCSESDMGGSHLWQMLREVASAQLTFANSTMQLGCLYRMCRSPKVSCFRIAAVRRKQRLANSVCEWPGYFKAMFKLFRIFVVECSVEQMFAWICFLKGFILPGRAGFSQEYEEEFPSAVTAIWYWDARIRHLLCDMARG